MQYILSEEEISDLVPRENLIEYIKIVDAARDFILKQNDYECIHDENSDNYGMYCDNCPIGNYDTPKKDGYIRQICRLHKTYSK